MSKVIIVSRTFPAYHPQKGNPTFFVEKIWQSLFNQGKSYALLDVLKEELENFSNPSHFIIPKNHTIRGGSRWKEGDFASLRVWSGMPYKSKQITIAPDIKIKKIWKIDIFKSGTVMLTRGNKVFYTEYLNPGWAEIAKNDGLSTNDLFNWFKMPCRFTGQVICWNENINY